MPEIAAAIAVAIDRIFEKRRWNELGLPEGAGPGRCHLREREMFLLFHAERIDEFAPAEIAARPLIAERSQRLEHVEAAHLRAIIAFQAPYRDQDFLLHAESLLDGRQCRRVGGEHRLALADARERYSAVEISPDRLHEFRLLEIELFE